VIVLLIPVRIRSVREPDEFRVSVPAMSSEPAPVPPAIVRDWSLSRFNEFEAPSVRLAMVGLMLINTGLLVPLPITALAVL
jgi:hypothetical protein